MARRSQCSSAGDNPLDPNYLPPHYREEYRLAVDALVEEDLEGYYQFLQKADVVDFLSAPEIQHIQSSVQVPQQSFSADQHFPEIGGDGSSDTYWPIHSDLDAPGLDLGWPQLHPFIGPTEVTTLVNPPEPDMPSIKEQARRLIKNAQQVVAIAMDMFTDVDVFSDILDAATRNVAVYIILDKQNAHHFVNMVSNCRVNLQTIQLLRVRTVSGITYHCRSGKSFQGQMMDRFLLTDCRAVLSGNYSFMWSYEKLHRCMAHLFLGQLVKTFDEEFRILFAQSHPLILENFAPADEFSILQKRPYPGERILFREQRKFQAPDGTYPEEWPRQSYDDRVDTDWRAMALKKQEARHAPTDLYGRFTPQQTRMDPPFDPGPSRVPMMENLAFKRHSYAEGSPGRYSYPFLQQGQPEPENQGRLFHRGQQPGPGPGKELDYGGNDKFWNQDFYSPDQYSESGLQQEMQPPDNFDPVLNYLSSTRNVDFDQGSEKSLPATLEQPHASNLTDQKQLLQEPNADRKDPMVKRGLRNWRISSYLSAYDNPGEEGLPSAPPNAADPFEEPSNPLQQTPGIDLSVPKIPNVREFKVPAIPRPSHLPSYIKTTTREQPKKSPDEPTAAAAETASTPSESSSSTEVEKMEEAEQKELRTSGLRREESFRRKHNAAVQRSSRLRSSLIFSSLEQQHTPQDTKTALDGQDEESESGQTKLPFASHVLGQRRSTPREPFEWSRYVKSATFDNSATDPSKPDDGTGKQDDKDSAKISEVQESLKPPDEAKLPKTDRAEQPPESLHTTPLFVDMNDPDMRLVFFKELAAKRRAAKAAEAEKSKEKALVQPPAELKDNAAGKKEEPLPKETSANISDTSEVLLLKNAGAEDAGKTVSTVSLTSDASDQKSKQASQVKTDPDASQSRRQEQTKDSADSAKAELKNSQSVASLRVSAETGAPQSKPPEQPKPTSPAVKTPHTPASAPPASAPPASAPPVAQGSESPRIDSTSKESGSLTPSSAEVTPSPSSASAARIPESLQLGTSISSPPPLPEQQTRSESGSSKPSAQSPSADHIRPDSGSQISSPSSSAPLSSPGETKSPKVTLEDSRSTITLSTSPPNAQECVLPSTPEHSTSSETLSAAHSAGLEPDKSSSQSSMKKDIPASENNSVPANREKSEDIKAVSPCLPKASDLEGKSAQNETITPTPLAPEAPPKHSETSSPVQPDSTPAAPQSERQATPPSQLNLTGSVTPAKTVSSPPTESVGSVLSPEAEKTLQSPSDTKQSPTNTTNTPPLPSGPAQPTSTVPTEPTSTVPTGPTSTVPKEPTSTVPTGPTSTVPTEPTSTVPTEPTSKVPTEPTSTVPTGPTSTVPKEPTSKVPTEPTSTVPTGPTSKVPTEPTSAVPTGPTSKVPTEPTSAVPTEPTSAVPTEPTSAVPTEPTSKVPTEPTSKVPTEPTSTVPTGPTSTVPKEPTSTVPTEPTSTVPTEPTSAVPTEPTSAVPKEPTSKVPTEPTSTVPTGPTSKVPTEPTSTVPTGPTSKVQAELDLACKTPQSVTSEPRPSEPPVSAENGKTDSQHETPEPSERKHDDTEAINEANKPNEKTNERVEQNNCSDPPETASDEVVPPSPQSKQPKSRYQSSTANVLSSSNLRDDTKLLLGQISANNQSRNEAAKELPVTDDEKEDEADKNAKREKQRGIGLLSRGEPKMTQEREKLLERIQSMRKERKVYSRFEMAP